MKKLSVNQIWFIFSLISLTIIGISAIHYPLRGDEKHITETVRLFAKNLSLETIKNYPEVTPPLFYIIYAFWAKIFFIINRINYMAISFSSSKFVCEKKP